MMANSRRSFWIYVLVVGSLATRSGTEPQDSACEFGQLPCDNGECITRKGWCDGPADCPDESDENYCRLRTPFDKPDEILNNCSKSLHFRCEAEDCIPKAARCDDMPDCSAGEDEENCDYYYQGSDGDAATSTTFHQPPPPPTTTTTTTTISTTSSSSTTTTPKPTSAGNSSSESGDSEAVKTALRFVKDLRDVEWGWGKATAKMVIALYLGNDSFFTTDNPDGQLSKKQLEVQLAIDLMRRHEVPLHLSDLSHYIHSLLVVCDDPKNFHGVNLVKLLKHEMNRRRNRHLFVSPLAYLALCNAGDTNDAHIRRIKNMAYRRTNEQRWLDIQAYALLTIACYCRDKQRSNEWKILKEDVAKNLSDWQHIDGSFGSVYSTGLALQALIAAGERDTDNSQTRALAYLKLQQNWEGSFGDEMDNFYSLPALNRKSMTSIGERHCKTIPSSTLSTEPVSERKRKKIHVHYSLWMGGDKKEIHTITIRLPLHSNFVEVMEAAERANPKYNHVMWMGNRGPVVTSIAGRSANVEKSLYWTLYRKVPLPFRPMISNATATSSRLRLLGATKYIKDIRKLYPKDGEHLAYWLKPYA